MEKNNCLRCNFRHKDNGNCTAVGGLCTAVPAARCPLLRQYLDTELTPEEIDMDHEAAETLRQLCRGCDLDRLEKLAEADKAGRLVVLPCKVGDTVYRLFTGNPDNPVISTLKINTAAEAVKLIGKMGMHKYIGTFLTHEEAEKALEAMK